MIVTRTWWILSILHCVFDNARSPLIAALATSNDHVSKKLVEENNQNIILQKLSPNTTISSSSRVFDKENQWLYFIGNLFHNVCLWFSDVLQVWKFYWWPTSKIIVTPDVGIELFRETGKISIINVTNDSLSSSPKVHTQSLVHSIVLQAGGPTSQPSRQPSRQPSSRPSRHPSSQPTRQPSARPSKPSGQPSRQPTRYNC